MSRSAPPATLSTPASRSFSTAAAASSASSGVSRRPAHAAGSSGRGGVRPALPVLRAVASSAAIGGQAVLEGVMMRGPSNWALAVRTPRGTIAEENHSIRSPMARHRVYRLPVIRGVIALGESLAIGFRALAISANYATQADGEEEGEAQSPSEITRGQMIFAFAL